MLPGRTVATLVLAALTAASAVQADGLHSVFSQNGTDVWAVGEAGRVQRSLDAGVTWSSQSLGVLPLRAVAAANLQVLIVGDDGAVWRSGDGGGTWAFATVAGTPDLLGLAMADAATAWVVGSSGTILKTTNGGASWTPQASGTSSTLRAVRFVDASQGWAVGDGGTVLHTLNGGGTWSPVSTGATTALLDVDARGSRVWVVGVRGVAKRSTNGGGAWSAVDLELDARSDVRSVWLAQGDSVYLAGGGGFIRRSANDGGTWQFLRHTLQSPLSSLHLFGGLGWACGPRTHIVLRSTGDGSNWAFPSGASQGRSWANKRRCFSSTGQIVGATFALNGQNPQTIYAAMAESIFVSRNAGDTWSAIGKFPTNVYYCNSLVVSPSDSNLMVAAVAGGVPRQIVRSTNGGVSWTKMIEKDYGFYGVPLEMHPDKPDTLYFGATGSGSGGSVLYRSTDFGATWNPYGSTTLGEPCDLAVVPGNGDVLIVGDGPKSSTGKYWRSTNGGQSFSVVQTVPTQEIPMVSVSRLRKSRIFGTNWGGSGSRLQKSDDMGATFPTIISTGPSLWGTDIAKDDPDVALFGAYGYERYNLTFDGGANITETEQVGIENNYCYYVRDRATLLSQQWASSNQSSRGIWKMQFTTNQPDNAPSASVTVAAPNGGEVWTAGQTRNVTWNATSVATARIEFRRALGQPWEHVADVPGTAGSYAWIVPQASTSQAKVRVRDAWDGSPTDSSNAVFTIQPTVFFAGGPDPLDLGEWNPGATAIDSFVIQNTGTAPLVVSSVTGDHPEFWAGRTSFTVPAGGSDTLGVFYNPQGAGIDTVRFTLVANDWQSPHVLRAVGEGRANVAVDGPRPAAFALMQNLPNPFARATTIRYALPVEAPVTLEVFGLQGQLVATLAEGVQPAGVHEVAFGPGSRGLRAPLAAGVYFYRLRAGAFVATRRMVVMR